MRVAPGGTGHDHPVVYGCFEAVRRTSLMPPRQVEDRAMEGNSEAQSSYIGAPNNSVKPMRRLLLCLALALAVQVVSAQGAEVVSDELRAHDFVAIERQFLAVEADFQAGRTSELDLTDAWKAFYPGPGREDMGRGLAAWLRERPDSWVAHAAFGTYWRKRGEASRGQDYIQNVPAEAQHQMRLELELAKPELWRALELNPRSWMAMLNLMNIAQFESDDALADKVLALSTKVYPHTLVIRARYLTHLTPRWGGSEAAMDGYMATVSKQFGLGNVLPRLEAVRCDEQGFVEESSGQLDRALQTYQRCMQMAHGSDPRFTGVYVLYAARHCEEGSDVNRVTCR